MDQFYTYLHCKPNGDPFYVGKGRRNRARQFFDSRRSKFHMNIVRKYGVENVGVFIFPCESEEQAFADEIQQIAQLRAEGFELANFTNGGEGHSGKGHVPWNKGIKGVCVAWNKGLKGPPAWNKGICGKDAHGFGNKSRTGQSQSLEERDKHRIAQKRFKASLSPEEKASISAKLSAANKGQIPWCKGRKQTPEHIAKRMESRRKNKGTKS